MVRKLELNPEARQLLDQAGNEELITTMLRLTHEIHALDETQSGVRSFLKHTSSPDSIRELVQTGIDQRQHDIEGKRALRDVVQDEILRRMAS